MKPYRVFAAIGSVVLMSSAVALADPMFEVPAGASDCTLDAGAMGARLHKLGMDDKTVTERVISWQESCSKRAEYREIGKSDPGNVPSVEMSDAVFACMYGKGKDAEIALQKVEVIKTQLRYEGASTAEVDAQIRNKRETCEKKVGNQAKVSPVIAKRLAITVKKADWLCESESELSLDAAMLLAYERLSPAQVATEIQKKRDDCAKAKAEEASSSPKTSAANHDKRSASDKSVPAESVVIAGGAPSGASGASANPVTIDPQQYPVTSRFARMLDADGGP